MWVTSPLSPVPGARQAPVGDRGSPQLAAGAGEVAGRQLRAGRPPAGGGREEEAAAAAANPPLAGRVCDH